MRMPITVDTLLYIYELRNNLNRPTILFIKDKKIES
jgi:hypothetical protein